MNRAFSHIGPILRSRRHGAWEKKAERAHCGRACKSSPQVQAETARGAGAPRLKLLKLVTLQLLV